MNLNPKIAFVNSVFREMFFLASRAPEKYGTIIDAACKCEKADKRAAEKIFQELSEKAENFWKFSLTVP